MIEEKYQNQIDDIMDYFDFEKVHEMMKAVNWTWYNEPEPPSIPS